MSAFALLCFGELPPTMKNLVVMLGISGALRLIDQEDALVLRYARLAYIAYLLFTVTAHALLHFKVTSRKDTNVITVPKQKKSASWSETMEKAKEAAEKRTGDEEEEDKRENESKDTDEGEEEKKDGEEEEKKEEKKVELETITVMEYDVRTLVAARRAFITNACILAGLHYKMESVSPLIMSGMMGMMKLLTEDKLVQIHIRGEPAVGPLKRPFKPPENPLGKLLKDFSGSKEESDATPGEDLHDDGDSEEDEADAPSALTDLTDEHIKSDFDEDETKKSK